jgi:hypothetical protein
MQQDTPSTTYRRFARVVSASPLTTSPPRLRLLIRTSSLYLRLPARTSSFRLRLRPAPRVNVEARDKGPTTNVAPPQRSNSPTTPCKAPVLHTWQSTPVVRRCGRQTLTGAVKQHSAVHTHFQRAVPSKLCGTLPHQNR